MIFLSLPFQVELLEQDKMNHQRLIKAQALQTRACIRAPIFLS